MESEHELLEPRKESKAGKHETVDRMIITDDASRWWPFRALCPAAALAGSLLSGYGGPGQGNQAILGSALLGGPRRRRLGRRRLEAGAAGGAGREGSAGVSGAAAATRSRRERRRREQRRVGREWRSTPREPASSADAAAACAAAAGTRARSSPRPPSSAAVGSGSTLGLSGADRALHTPGALGRCVVTAATHPGDWCASPAEAGTGTAKGMRRRTRVIN